MRGKAQEEEGQGGTARKIPATVTMSPGLQRRVLSPLRSLFELAEHREGRGLTGNGWSWSEECGPPGPGLGAPALASPGTS
jgi:hypothetical protein